MHLRRLRGRGYHSAVIEARLDPLKRPFSGALGAALATLALTALLAILDGTRGLSRIAGLALVCACIVAACAFVRSLGPPPRRRLPLLAAFGVAIALVVALAMGASTEHSPNPDERNHFGAAIYYAGRWLPPAVGDPASLPSYSTYGLSYLNELDVSYLLAANFAAALSFTGLDEPLRLRLFNVALLVLCAACALRSRTASRVLLPLLCTAQAWYVFGYFNGDAMGLASAFLLAIAVAAWLEQARTAAAGAAQWRWAITLGLLVALCLLSKRTFYPFLPFIVGYGLWRSGLRSASAYQLAGVGLALLALWFYMGPPAPGVRALMPPAGPRDAIALVALLFVAWGAAAAVRGRPAGTPLPRALFAAVAIGAAIFALRVAIDVGVNGLPAQKALALRALAERIASPPFRPSVLGTPASYFSLTLAAKGIGLGEMFTALQWPSHVAESFFGLYGYLDVAAPAWMYAAQDAAGAVLAASVALPLARRTSSRAVLALGVAGAVLAFELAVLNSWVVDFQPQGRYLFAILPIAGVLLLQRSVDGDARPADRWADRIAMGAIGALWLLAVMSFAFVALARLTQL
jgi:hypothetical protein